MIQTWAMLVDAYRELNAKRLFWITLVLSGLVVAAFASVGLTPTGLQVLWFDIPVKVFNSTIIEPATFYKLVFANLGIKFWLAWGATILALISTAGIFPDFVSSGSIELTLSKPISRLRLYLTKYLTGLLFVTLQVGVFSLAAFMVIGIRGGAWLPGLFWAVPIIVLFFSYLFSICALVGLMTRSTIAALLVTVLAWLLFFGLHATDTVFVSLRENSTLRAQTLERRIERLEKSASERVIEKRQDAADDGVEVSKAVTPAEIDAQNPRLAEQRTKLENERVQTARWAKWSRIFYAIKTPLPKTRETIDVLERVLITEAEMARFRPDDEETTLGEADDVRVNHREINTAIAGEFRGRSLGWILGTSAAFEAFILAIGAWIFCRRDF